MPILPPQPKAIPHDTSRLEEVSFISPADASPRTALVYSPAETSDAPLPLVLAPHPITWTAEQEYQGGWDGMQKWGYHRGWHGLADQYKVIIALPHGHHRHEENCSLGGPEQIEDMVHLIDVLREQGYHVDSQRIYTCGKSMGGQEALVLAGKHPERVAAVVAFNPIVDLAAWQEDLAISDVSEIREFETDKLVANEVGGLPADVPELYAERSAAHYVDGLALVPTLIFWSDEDLIVPRQITHHSYRLYQMVKKQSLVSPVAEYNHTKAHGLVSLDKDIRWQLHEWCDYELALKWLLHHRAVAFILD
jgi:predicted peptidase